MPLPPPPPPPPPMLHAPCRTHEGMYRISAGKARQAGFHMKKKEAEARPWTAVWSGEGEVKMCVYRQISRWATEPPPAPPPLISLSSPTPGHPPVIQLQSVEYIWPTSFWIYSIVTYWHLPYWKVTHATHAKWHVSFCRANAIHLHYRLLPIYRYTASMYGIYGQRAFTYLVVNSKDKIEFFVMLISGVFSWLS